MSKVFGEKLRILRKEKGVKQSEIAEFCNTTKYSVSAWELGKQEPNIDTLLLLAHYFDVTLDYLMGNEK